MIEIDNVKNDENDNNEGITLEEIDTEASKPLKQCSDALDDANILDEPRQEISDEASNVNSENTNDIEVISDEEIAKLLEDDNFSEDIPQDIEKTIDINVNGVEKNEQLGSKKIEKLADGPGKLIALGISLGIALLVLVFCIYALLR